MKIKMAFASIGLLGLFSSPVFAIEKGDIITVTLEQLHPTQPSVGYDQVMYKLGRYQFDRKKMFDEICETNGQKGIKNVTPNSQPNLANSFECKATVGEQKKDMKTIALAPNGQYFLTDGHHTFNVFYQMPNGGAEFKVNVVVADDYRHLDTMNEFWLAMQKDGNTWLYDHNEHPIHSTQLPTSLGLEQFRNDIYRSLMYFSRDVAWNKPKDPIPFLEFYWSKELRKKLDVQTLELNSTDGYANAIQLTSKHLLSMQQTNVGGSHLDVKQMGQFDEFKQKGFDKLFRSKGKIDYMLRYKIQPQ